MQSARLETKHAINAALETKHAISAARNQICNQRGYAINAARNQTCNQRGSKPNMQSARLETKHAISAARNCAVHRIVHLVKSWQGSAVASSRVEPFCDPCLVESRKVETMPDRKAKHALALRVELP